MQGGAIGPDPSSNARKDELLLWLLFSRRNSWYWHKRRIETLNPGFERAGFLIAVGLCKGAEVPQAVR